MEKDSQKELIDELTSLCLWFELFISHELYRAFLSMAFNKTIQAPQFTLDKSIIMQLVF